MYNTTDIKDPTHTFAVKQKKMKKEEAKEVCWEISGCVGRCRTYILHIWCVATANGIVDVKKRPSLLSHMCYFHSLLAIVLCRVVSSCVAFQNSTRSNIRRTFDNFFLFLLFRRCKNDNVTAFLCLCDRVYVKKILFSLLIFSTTTTSARHHRNIVRIRKYSFSFVLRCRTQYTSVSASNLLFFDNNSENELLKWMKWFQRPEVGRARPIMSRLTQLSVQCSRPSIAIQVYALALALSILTVCLWILFTCCFDSAHRTPYTVQRSSISQAAERTHGINKYVSAKHYSFPRAIKRFLWNFHVVILARKATKKETENKIL